MSGEELGERAVGGAMPRGVLTYWLPGSGKTLGFVAAGLYTLTRRKREYINGVIVLIMNKSLQANAVKEIESHVNRLNSKGLGLDLLPTNRRLNL